MHSAPAVSYPVGRSRFQGCLVGVNALMGALAGLLWHFQAHPDVWRQGVLAASLLGACSLAIAAWRRTPKGILRWDGQAWRWTSVNMATSGVVSVLFDWQVCLLLSLRTDAGDQIWLWPERRANVMGWNDLRRAVFSRRGAVHASAADAEAALAQVRP